MTKTENIYFTTYLNNCLIKKKLNNVKTASFYHGFILTDYNRDKYSLVWKDFSSGLKCAKDNANIDSAIKVYKKYSYEN